MKFVAGDGTIRSAHELPYNGSLSTAGQGTAYLAISEMGVAAFRAEQGQVWTLDIPGVKQAVARGGVLCAITEDRGGSFVLRAFEEPV